MRSYWESGNEVIGSLGMRSYGGLGMRLYWGSGNETRSDHVVFDV